MSEAAGAAPQARPGRQMSIVHVLGSAGQRSSTRPFDYLVCGNPRSTLLVAGSGQRDVTTLPRV